jgi:outer membrane protein assembly factor BamE (lipoprotein component of BamABCDE complex)
MLAKAALVGPGMTKQQVLDAMGPPGDRSFRGTAEAWQYCSNDDVATAKYTTVWLDGGQVSGLTTQSKMLMVSFSCADEYPSIDWGQRPADIKTEQTVHVD